MTRRAYLHVGSPKTGTTFLQQVLWAQRDVAREEGLLLPLDGFRDHYHACLDVREVAGAAHLPDHAAGTWARLVEESKSWSGNVLVSHELFAPATAEQAARAVSSLADAFEVHVVLTARDLVRQIPAEWQQHVKARLGVSLPRFVANVRSDGSREGWFWTVQDFAGVLRRWGATLPASQLHLVTVPPPSSPPELLWHRFAAAVGLDPDRFRLDGIRSNPSLGLEQAEVLRLVNKELGDRLPKPGPYHSVVIRVLAERILTGRDGRPLRLEPDDHALAARLSRGVADDLRDLGVDVVGDLADLAPSETPVGAEDEPYSYALGADVVRHETVAALAGLLDEYSSRRTAAAARRRELSGRIAEVRARLGRVRQERVGARAELSQAQRRVEELTRTVTQLEERLADVEADRDRLAGRRGSPVRAALVGLSERWPVLMPARKVYRRALGAARERRSDGWGEG
jgi:hypothetical protein